MIPLFAIGAVVGVYVLLNQSAAQEPWLIRAGALAASLALTQAMFAQTVALDTLFWGAGYMILGGVVGQVRSNRSVVLATVLVSALIGGIASVVQTPQAPIGYDLGLAAILDVLLSEVAGVFAVFLFVGTVALVARLRDPLWFASPLAGAAVIAAVHFDQVRGLTLWANVCLAAGTIGLLRLSAVGHVSSIVGATPPARTPMQGAHMVPGRHP